MICFLSFALNFASFASELIEYEKINNCLTQNDCQQLKKNTAGVNKIAEVNQTFGVLTSLILQFWKT